MSVTPNFNWPLIEPTDFVTNLPADFETFADAVDADLAGLLGGTTGQVLTKDSNTDHDFSWQNPATGSNVILNGGLSNNWIRTLDNSALVTFAPTTSVTYYTPVFLPAGTYNRIGFTSAAYTSTGNARLGIYANSIGNRPDTLLLDAGTVSVTATNTDYSITISQTLDAGWYWLAINRQSGIFSFPGLASGVSITMAWETALNATAASGSQINTKGYRQTGVTGAFANAGTLVADTTPAVCAVRFA